MHIQTHILSGWCIANYFPLTPRERLLSMIAASIPDLDGLGILISQERYWDFHHVIGHGIFFAILACGVLTIFSKHKLLAMILYLALFHLHLILDVLGSGQGWRIYYFWPLSKWGFKIDWGWELYSWQNITAFCILFAWTILIAKQNRRTPLEVLIPSLDRQLIDFV